MNETVLDNDVWTVIRDVMRFWLEDPGVEEHQGLNMSSLKMDQAYMIGEADRNVGVYYVSDDCFRVSIFLFYAPDILIFTLSVC